MEKVHDMIGEIYNLLAVIPVRGDGIETMCQARELLRQAYRATEKAEGTDNA